MPTAKKSALNLTLNRQHLALSAALLFTASSISHADNISATNNMPTPESQEAPVQEMLIEETPNLEMT